MIRVYAPEESFHYDIHSLIQAFYPGEEVSVKTGSDEEPDYSLILKMGEGITLLLADGNGRRAEASLSADTQRSELKSAIKRLIYAALSEWLGKTLPWGTLTGIRPTKLAMDMLREGKGEEEILSRLQGWYLVSEEKARLALEIAEREKKLLEGFSAENGYSLYVGIPFCPSRCLYCSFASNPITYNKKTGELLRVEEYLTALFQELEHCARLMKGRRPDSIYIGGGTPTALPARDLERLLDKLAELFPAPLAEYTVEAGRPDSITKEKLLLIRNFGAGRISVNPQTMNDETLERIGRRHTAEETIRAFMLARELGFRNINMDLILGLPGEGEKELTHTLDEIERLSPDSLTVHALAVKRASRLREALMKAPPPPNPRREAASSLADSCAPPEGIRKCRFNQHSLREQQLGAREKQTENNIMLTKDPNTAFSQHSRQETNEAPAMDFGRLSSLAEERARAMGLLPYYLYRQKNMAGNLENVGYARKGCFGAYNILMMEEVEDIVACGAGTISKRVYSDGRIERCDDVKELAQYCGRIDEMIERKRRLFDHLTI